MKILVVGGGGREHAIIKALKKNKTITEIFAAPGNGGIEKDATCEHLIATDKIIHGGIFKVAVSEKIRIKLKSYDHTLIDAAAEKIVDAAKRNGATVSGPVPLPTDKEIVTILRAVHKYKDSREQFEMRTHKRLIDVIKPSQKAIEAITSLELPAGVEIEVKL